MASEAQVTIIVALLAVAVLLWLGDRIANGRR